MSQPAGTATHQAAEPAWAAELSSALPADVLLSLQMCCPVALTRTPALSLLLFFKKDKSFRSGVCATIPTDGYLVVQ